MLIPLVRKLETFAKMTAEDRRTLEEVTDDIREFRPRQDIIGEDERPDHVHLMLKDWAARYKILPGGERPILGYLIPGDLCDVHVTLLDAMDHSITTLSACTIAFIGRDRIDAILSENGTLARALWWSTLVDEAILREWLVTVGHRPADKRLAYFICEMLLRMRAAGLADGNSFDLPVTQEEIDDTMGLSTVHVNRTLQELRAQGLVASKGRRMTVNDLERLCAFADFNPNYLHQQNQQTSQRREGRHKTGTTMQAGSCP
ncbi:Crp/Fnr family transcriptional regulator [Microvirga sp. GCM10011540]|uniref:Crp/Fnr family transcriptional regulator n=1 Tax=Microvirga sp. GCM10011540 TaxID=3317338 RepID=UPI00361608DC